MLSCIPPFFHHALAFQRSLIKAPSILIPEMLPKIFHQNKNIGGLMPPIFLSYLFAVTTGRWEWCDCHRHLHLWQKLRLSHDIGARWSPDMRGFCCRWSDFRRSSSFGLHILWPCSKSFRHRRTPLTKYSWHPALIHFLFATTKIDISIAPLLLADTVAEYLVR